jgi:hypothetical protein
MADITDLLDPYRMEEVVRQIDAMSRNVERLTRHVTGAADATKKAVDTAKRGMEEVERKTSKLAADFSKFQSMLHGLTMEGIASTALKNIDKMVDGWRKYRDEVRKAAEEAKRAASAQTVEEFRTPGSGGGQPAGLMSRMGQGIMNNLPFGAGGLIGLMMYGKKRSEEFDAAATRIARIFDQVGQGQRAFEGVRGTIDGLVEGFNSSGEELAAVAQHFREVGLGAEVFDEIDHKVTGFGKHLVGATTALETFNKMAPGSIAKMMGEVFEAGGTDRKALLGDFMSLDRVAQQTHVSIERLMNSMTQGAVSLRVQRQGVGDLSSAYMKLYGALAGGAMKGAAPEAVGAAAMRGVQAAASGITGLSEGLMAEISRRMGGPEGVGGIVAMQEGLSGKGAGRVFEELGRLAQEVTGGGTREEQIFALEKIAPSLGFEGARAVVNQMFGGKDFSSIADSIKDPTTKLKEAFEHRSAEESAWEKVQRKILVELAKIGSSMLTAVLTGFDATVKGLAAIGDPTSLKKQKAAKEAYEASDAAFGELMPVAKEAFKNIERAVEAAGMGGGVFHGRHRGHGPAVPNADPVAVAAANRESAKVLEAGDRAWKAALRDADSIMADYKKTFGGLSPSERNVARSNLASTISGQLSGGGGFNPRAALEMLEQQTGLVHVDMGFLGLDLKLELKQPQSTRGEAPH